MTKKIFYEALYQTEFDAEVLDIIDGKGAVLDQTLFYPGGGGQPCDLGELDGFKVLDVLEDKSSGIIIHVLDEQALKKIKLNSKVHGIIDWTRRFELMQQHLGEHIFAAVLYNKFNINVLRMRIEGDIVSLDIDKTIDADIIREAELEANEIIWRNIPVEVIYANLEELKKFSRKQPPAKAGINLIRTVRISGVDCVPCCGLHVKNTGEVGIIKFVASEHGKDFTRVYIKCGRAAYNWLSVLANQAHKTQLALTCGESDIYSRVETLQSDLKELTAQNKILHEQIASMQSEKILGNAVKSQDGHVIAAEVIDCGGSEALKILFKSLTKRPDIIALLGCRINKQSAFIIFGAHKNAKGVDVREAFKAAIKIIDGKGGGSPVCAQGFGSRPEGLNNAINQARDLILNLF